MIGILRLLIMALILVLAGQLHATTYHVAATGNDNNNGLSWAAAWATVDKVNATLRAGDTVLFGSGQFLGGKIVPPAGGTLSQRTVYACSTLSSDSWYNATISSGEAITGWTINSGNIYQAPYVGNDCFGDNNNSYTMTQNGRLMIPRDSRSGLTQSGMFYHDGSTMYAWLYDNTDPNSQEMLSTCRATVHLTRNDQDHILFYGLDFRLGKQGVVLFSAGADSVFFEHCNFFGAGQSAGENPSLILSRNYDAPPHDWGEYNTFVACSLSGAFPVDGTPPDFYSVSANHRGAGAVLYITRYMTFDSCVFYNLAGPGVMWKSDMGVSGDNRVVGNVVKYCKFIGGNGMSHGVWIGGWAHRDSVYGCTFSNTTESAIRIGGFPARSNEGRHFIGNNTFYNCASWYWAPAPNPPTDSTIEIKYNIGSSRWNSGTSNWWEGDVGFKFNSNYVSAQAAHLIDSNIWFEDAVPYSFYRDADSPARTWAYWQGTGGFDIHSDSTDPELNDPANGDFSRPGASGEMNVTYGGKTWTVFGAVQDPCQTLADNFLTAPVDSDTLSLPVLLQWQSQAGASQYQVQVAINSNFLSPEINEVVGSTSYSASSLVEGRTYYWRVRAFDAAEGWSCWTSAWSFTASCPSVPATPALTGPSDGASGLSQPVNLQWNSVSGASKYELELDQSAGFGDPQLFTVFGTNSFSASNLVGGNTYYWRVRGCNDCGCGTYSQPNSFSVNFDTTSSGAINLAAGRTPTVDGTYAGYSVTAITDGVIDPRGGTATTWASNESSSEVHWIEIDFGGSVQVNGVNIHWAWNSSANAWMTSQQYSIEGWIDDTTSVTLANLTNPTVDSSTSVSFQSTEVKKMRVSQPANSGSALYPTVFWLTELEVIGGVDTIPPAAIDDLSALPGSSHGVIDLNWLASGNDGLTGIADHYAVQVRLSAPLGQSTTTVNFEGVEAGGIREYNSLRDLIPGAKYDLTVIAYDAAGLSSAPVSQSGVFAGGILTPSVVYTILDSIAGSVTISCDAVESYYVPLSYDFVVAADSLFSFSDTRILSAINNLAGPETFALVDPAIDHYWHCRAVSFDPADSSNWSRTIRFNTGAGIIYEELAEIGLKVRAGPSPVNFMRGQSFSFYLPPNPVNLIIMDMAGGRVLQRDGISGVWQWDGQTSGGSRVAAGIYLWYINDGDSWQSGKIMVQS